MPYRKHLRNSSDLVTEYAQVRAGFVKLALEKNRRATPFVAEARTLKVKASAAKTASDLKKIPDIQAALLTASGVSDKAAEHMGEADKTEAVANLITNFLEPAGKDFVEELVFRFLLTRGDSLGGAMRNVAGALAQAKVTRFIMSSLKLAGKAYEWQHCDSRVWAKAPESDADIENNLRGISWTDKRGVRTLIFNLKVNTVGNNIDMCLLACTPADVSSASQAPESFIALGELKGGIDPAGADEHWKTARSALERIRKGFKEKGLAPHTFYIGAAVEKRMAEEIWARLEASEITNAANLTSDEQLVGICSWLTSL